MIKSYYSFLFFVFGTFQLFSQTPNPRLQGLIEDLKKTTPLYGVNVYFKNSRIGTMTDKTGRYRFDKLPASTDSLIIQMIGYKRVTVYRDWAACENEILDFKLESSPILLQQVVKEAERYTLLEPVVYRLESRKLLEIPALAEPDVMRAIHVLPGVTRTDDFNSTPYFRGGDAHQAGLFVNGVPIFNAFHFAGLYSLVHPGILESMEVKPGGYPVNYGNFLSGLVLMKFRPGSSEKLKGNFNLSLLATSLLLESQLPGKNNSFIWSVRRSHLELLTAPMGKSLPYYFYDTQGRIDFEISQSDQVNFSFLYGYDQVGLDEYDHPGNEKKCHWDNFVLSLDWLHQFSPVFYSQTIFGLSTNHFNQGERPEPVPDDYIPNLAPNLISQSGDVLPQIRNEIFSCVIKHQFDYRLSRNRKIYFGFEYNNFSVNYKWAYLYEKADYFAHRGVNRFFDYEPIFYSFRQKSNMWSTYFQFLAGLDQRFSYGIGMRLSMSDILSGICTEPRLHFQYKLNSGLRLKGALGRYQQQLITAKEEGGFDFDNSAVYYFNKAWFSIEKPLQRSKAIQTLLGVEVDVSSHLKFTIHGYYNNFSYLFRVEPQRSSYFLKSVYNDGYPIFSSGDGQARGVEFYLQYDNRLLSIYTSYVFSQTLRKFDNSVYFGKQDCRHALKFYGKIQLGKKWDFSILSNFHSGLPYTPPIGKYSSKPSQGWELILGEKNSARLSAYYRFDIRLAQKIRILNKPGKFYFNIQNISNQKNILAQFNESRGIGGYADTGSPKYQLPIIPSLGITIYLGAEDAKN